MLDRVYFRTDKTDLAALLHKTEDDIVEEPLAPVVEPEPVLQPLATAPSPAAVAHRASPADVMVGVAVGCAATITIVAFAASMLF